MPNVLLYVDCKDRELLTAFPNSLESDINIPCCIVMFIYSPVP